MTKTHSFVALLFSALFAIAAKAHEPYQPSSQQHCDYFQGKWIFSPNKDQPYSQECRFIHNRQNCLKNGRPNKEYLHWTWKPHDCELPPFDPDKFLLAMTDKSFAFVGDSVVRNQKESLLCLLSMVEEPLLVYLDESSEYTNTWYFPSYNFTLSMVWSTHLLHKDDEKRDGIIQLHLDVLDNSWTDVYHKFDYMLISTGTWFNGPFFMLENNTVIGCHSCATEDLSILGPHDPYRRALSLVFGFLVASEHKPLVIYRNFSPTHFEPVNLCLKGYCNRTLPFEKGEVAKFMAEGADEVVERISREEFTQGVAAAGKNGAQLEMLDIYYLSVLRPDGHPDAYSGSLNHTKHDCVHWCLPGMIDTWNDLMMEMIFRNKDQLGPSLLRDGRHVI